MKIAHVSHKCTKHGEQIHLKQMQIRIQTNKISVKDSRKSNKQKEI